MTQEPSQAPRRPLWRLDEVVLDYQRRGHLVEPLGPSAAPSCGACGVAIRRPFKPFADADWIHL